MSIDYDRLRELRDEATPGPWEFREEQEWEHVAGPEYPPMLTRVEHTVEGNGGEPLFGNSNDAVLEERPGNLRLAALAPDMARELLRLRDELADLRDLMHTHAGYLHRDGQRTAADYAHDHAHRITRIMQGDTE